MRKNKMKSVEVRLTKKEIVEPKVDFILELEHVKVKANESDKPIFKVEGSKQLGKFLVSEIGDYTQEVLMALYLNTKNEVLYKQNLFVGVVDEANVSPFQVVQSTVLVNAPKVVIAHNHPSSHIEYPSDNDVEFTQRLNACLQMLGVDLLDSFVVSVDSYCSLAECGLLYGE